MDDSALTSALCEDPLAGGRPPGGSFDFRLLAESIPHLVWSAGADGVPDYWNARLLSYLGRTAEEMPGRAWFDTLHPDDRQRSIDAWAEAVATGADLHNEFRMRCGADGRYRWHVTIATPLQDATGKILRWFGTCTDIEERKHAEDQLRNSERKFRALHESMMDAFVSVDMSGRLVEFNHAYEELLGYTGEELRGKTYVDLTPEKWHDFEARIVAEQVLPRGYSEVYEKEYRRKDGSIVPIELRTSLVRSADGEPEHMWAIIRDISGRKRLEEKLQESESLFRAFMDNAPTIAWMKDEQYRYIYFSRNLERQFGVQFADCQGKTDFELWPQAVAESLRNNDREVLNSGQSRLVEEQTVDGEGNPCFWLNSKFLFRNAAGRPCIGGVGVNITERVRTEEQLKASEEQFRTIMEVSPDVISIVREDGILAYCSPAVIAVLGYSPEEIQGAKVLELIHPDDQPRIEAFIAAMFSEPSEIRSIEYRCRTKNGAYRWMESLSSCQRHNRYVSGLVSVSRDVTERKYAEETLRDNEQRLSFYVENSPMATIEWDAEFLVKRWSADAEKVFGWSREETIGKAILDLHMIYEEDMPQVEKVMCDLQEGNGKYVISSNRNYTKDGRVISCEWYNTILRNLQGETVAVLSQVMDVTERKRIEEALRTSEERYRAIVESQTEFVTRFLPGGIITFANQALAKWHGLPAEAIVGRSFYHFLHEDDRDETIRKIESLSAENPIVTVDERVLSPRGKLSWHQWTNRALFDGQGNFVEYQGVGRDVTAQKEAEQYLAEAKQILEHEVRERTSSLVSANELLTREIEERKRIQQDLLDYQRQLEAMGLEVSIAADRERARIAGELHDQVGQRLILSRIKLDTLASQLPVPVYQQLLQELQQLVDQTIKDIRSLTFQLRPPLLANAGLVAAVQWLGEELKESYGLITEVVHDAIPIMLSYETSSCIFQVIRELLLNVAKHAATDRASVSFATAANTISITVADHGIGFDSAQVLERHQRSDGFGLFNIQQRIEHLGGCLLIESMPGEGSRATIIVPLPPGKTEASG